MATNGAGFMLNHLIDEAFRAAAFRSAHFLPLSAVLAVIVVAGAILVMRSRR
jgi:hypothetical protein